MSLLIPDGTLGRYSLLGRLATGGMAEVYLARQSGPSGFSKVVVVKVILPHLANDPSFMRMFRNEAKLAALLNHPNVVQIFDYGEEDALPYMAMEYIDGRNLNRIGKTLSSRGKSLPRPIVLRVISDTCGALEYAHGLTDTRGDLLRIIHRDISRENILVTYSGQIKLVDFGIAKATILESSTTSGALKGKYSYMAPEMIRGQEVDRRIDIYGVGVVLYALLVGRLPFRAENTAQLIDLINNTEPDPPREVDPSLPEELEQIVLRAMRKDRAQRYQTAGELQADLERYLMEHESAVMPYHLAQFMKETFPPGSDKDRETYHSLTGATPAEPSQVPLSPDGRPAWAASTVTLPTPTSASSSSESTKRRGPGRRLVVVLGALLLVVGAVAGYLAVRSPRGEPAVRIQQTADAALLSRTAPDLSGAAPEARNDAGVEVAPVARGDVGPPPKAGKKAQPRVTLRPRVRPGHLSVSAPGPGAVFLGTKLLGALPLEQAQLRAGTHVLTVRSIKLGYSMTRQVRVAPGEHQRLQLTPRKGTIRILVHPWARVTLDGRLLGITPLDPIQVYEGPHRLVFRRSR